MRVSTLYQNPALPLDALKATGCERIFTEKVSGGAFVCYTGAMMFKPLVYGMIILFVLLMQSWVGLVGTLVILLVLVTWTVWDVWRALHP